VKEPPMDNWRLRMKFGWGALVIAALVGFIFTVAVARHRIPNFKFSHGSAPQLACSTVGCAKLGDSVTYVLSGRVTSVSSPQAGVVCVQVQSQKSGGDFCALAP
jgi:hypothetical protein